MSQHVLAAGLEGENDGMSVYCTHAVRGLPTGILIPYFYNLKTFKFDLNHATFMTRYGMVVPKNLCLPNINGIGRYS